MSKNITEPDSLQKTIQRMCIACWIAKTIIKQLFYVYYVMSIVCVRRKNVVLLLLF